MMMIRATAYLITESPMAHGAHATKTQTERMVYCSVRSIGQNEYYNAHLDGLKPELKLVLSRENEYKGELKCKYSNKMYDIIRTYTDGNGKLELTLQREE